MICYRCGLGIAEHEVGVQHMGTDKAHQEYRCRELLKEQIQRLRNLCWDSGVCPECGAKADCYGGNAYCTNCEATKESI